LVVEVSVGRLSWASTTPLDPGTRRVAQDGLHALLDPEQRLARLLGVVRGEGQVPRTATRSMGLDHIRTCSR
jgi:hypothetical protein